MLVVAGVALTAAGAAKLIQGDPPLDKDEKIVKAGISILTVSWGFLFGLCGISMMSPRTTNNSVERAGTVVSFVVLVLVGRFSDVLIVD